MPVRPPPDTAQRLVAEMTTLINRAIALGRRLGEQTAVDKIVAAVQQQRPPMASRTHAPEPVLPGIAPRDRGPGKRKHPYGMVKQTVVAVLKSNPQGVTRQQIREGAHASHGVTIDDGAIKNTLKVLLRDKEAHSKDGTYFLGPA